MEEDHTAGEPAEARPLGAAQRLPAPASPAPGLRRDRALSADPFSRHLRFGHLATPPVAQCFDATCSPRRADRFDRFGRLAAMPSWAPGRMGTCPTSRAT